MRVFWFVCLMLVAPQAAQAETWRILHWDRFSLLAVDAEHQRPTGLGNTALRVLEVRRYPTSARAEALLGEQEVDCSDQRVRTRTAQMFLSDGERTGLDDEIQAWRDPGEESDRLLIRAVCKAGVVSEAPVVKAASVQEPLAAHLAVTSSKSLEGMPTWAAAWSAFAALNVENATPSIEIVTQSRNPLIVAAISNDGALILVSADIQKAGEMRYRFHEAHIGQHATADIAATWALREADCELRRVRNLAWAGFDEAARKKFGHDTSNMGVVFEDARPGSSDEVVVRTVCGSRQAIAGKPAVSSSLVEAITAYRWFFLGDDAAGSHVQNAEAWRGAYLEACGARCMASDDEANGSTASSSTRGSRS